MLRYSDRRWIILIVSGCRLIRKGIFLLLFCTVAPFLFVTASQVLHQWNSPPWSIQLLDGLAGWGMGLALLVAMGLLMVGLAKLFSPNPYDEFSWMPAVRRGINFASVPTLALWVSSDQTNFGASMFVQLIPVVGAIELSAHAIAVLHLTAVLKVRCAEWPQSRVVSILGIAFVGLLCAAIIVASVLEQRVETLRLLWLIWILVIVASSVSLAPRLQREIAMPLDGV